MSNDSLKALEAADCPFCGATPTQKEPGLNFQHPDNDCFYGPSAIPLAMLDKWNRRAALSSPPQAVTSQSVGRDDYRRGIYDAKCWLRDQQHKNPPDSLWHAAAILADRMDVALLSAEPASKDIKCKRCNDTGWTIGNGTVREGCLNCDAQLNMVRAAEPAPPPQAKADPFKDNPYDDCLGIHANANKVPASPPPVGEQGAVEHWSDCATHNEPAMPNGPCDCGGYTPLKAWRVLALEAIESVQSACRETNWGQPTFGLSEGERLERRAKSLDAAATPATTTTERGRG